MDKRYTTDLNTTDARCPELHGRKYNINGDTHTTRSQQYSTRGTDE